MVIRASAARQIDTLIADLASASSVTRDAAIARLTVIGARAVERLLAVAGTADGAPGTRAAALRALQGIADPRAFDTAVTAAMALDATVADAGIGVLRHLLHGPKETPAIEALTDAALDAGRPSAVRLAAANALTDLGPAVLKPLWTSLSGDPDASVREWVATRAGGRKGRPGPQAAPVEAGGLAAMIERGLPDDPAAVRQAIARDGVGVPLIGLRRVIETIREREDAAPRRQAEWAVARAAAHVALAARGSRVALYDLRDSLTAAATPLPVEFLSAVTRIGDPSCLEPLAAAYARSTRAGEEWWRQHLRHAFHTIVFRERITRRHAAMKKVLARWPAIVK